MRYKYKEENHFINFDYDRITFRGSGKDFFDYMTNYFYIWLVLFVLVSSYFITTLSDFLDGCFFEIGTIIFVIFLYAFIYAVCKVPEILESMNKSDFEVTSKGIHVQSKKHSLFVEKNDINTIRLREFGVVDGKQLCSICIVTYDPIRIGKSIFKRSVFYITGLLSIEEGTKLFNEMNRLLDIKND